MSNPKIGETYFTVETIHNKHPEAANSQYVTVLGSHHGIRVDAPNFTYGQVFTSEQAAREGSWALGQEMPWATKRIVRGRYVGGPYTAFERV